MDGAGCETGWCDIQQTFHGIYIFILLKTVHISITKKTTHVPQSLKNSTHIEGWVSAAIAVLHPQVPLLSACNEVHILPPPPPRTHKVHPPFSTLHTHTHTPYAPSRREMFTIDSLLVYAATKNTPFFFHFSIPSILRPPPPSPTPKKRQSTLHTFSRLLTTND